MKPRKQYTVQLEDDVIARIDKMAAKLEHNRSQLMRNFIIGGLEDVELVDKTGIFTAVFFSRDLMRKFKKAILNGKVSLDKQGEIEIKK
jgi:metal-responsive CopG/Arc/MetJ family transcriptional regulator